jgi:hypothetical protein
MLKDKAQDLFILSDVPLYKKFKRNIANVLQEQRISYEENIRIESFHVDFKVGNTVILLSGPLNKNEEGSLHKSILMKKNLLSSDYEVVIIDEDEWLHLSPDKQISFLWENKITKKKLKY